MTERTLYLQRADRGDRLVGLRLIGPRTDEQWHAPPARGLDDALTAIREGAAWIRERLQVGQRASLASICLDPDGSICSWLTSPTDDPTVLAAIARGAAEAHHADAEESTLAAPRARALDHFAGVGAGLAIQALGEGVGDDPASNGHARSAKAKPSDAAHRRRLPILGVPDSAAAMLVDALDDQGIAAPSIVTLWHAMAMAWDPAARDVAQTAQGDRLVAEASPVAAIVLVEPQGRLTWAWSRAGTLLTGGTMRLPRARHAADSGASHARSDAPRIGDTAPIPRLEPTHAARLTADWLAWSAQTGAAPARVVILTPERTAGMPPQELASALVRAWPQATTDLVTDEDPVLFTLQRAIGEQAAPPPPDASVRALAMRPAKAHRAMFTWSALAIASLALAAGTVAVMAWRTGASARDRATSLRRSTSEMAMEHYQDPTAFAAGIVLSLQDDLARLQAEARPADTSEFRPILQEAQNISMVVSSLIASSPRSRFISLTIDNALPTRLVVQVPDLTTYEQVRDALRDAGVSELIWSETPQRQERPDPAGGTMLETTFIATWRTSPGPGGTP